MKLEKAKPGEQTCGAYGVGDVIDVEAVTAALAVANLASVHPGCRRTSSAQANDPATSAPRSTRQQSAVSSMAANPSRSGG